MRLTAVRITRVIIRLVDCVSIKLALGCDIRNARRDLIPPCEARRVTREEGHRWLPYRWEVGNVLGNGRVCICCTFSIRIWENIISEKRESAVEKARMRTGYLHLRLLVGATLGRDVVMTAKAMNNLNTRANQTWL